MLKRVCVLLSQLTVLVSDPPSLNLPKISILIPFPFLHNHDPALPSLALPSPSMTEVQTNKAVRYQLFIMMILELLIWGAWLPLIWDYMGPSGLNFTGNQVAWVGSAFAIASVIGIFFSNQFADRNFEAQKFLAFSHLVGGLAILGMFWVKSFPLFFGLMVLHSLFYVPTLSVANSLAFANLRDPAREFGPVRMGGTIGWILAAWPFYFILGNKTGQDAMMARNSIFLVAGIASLLLSAFCLILPRTPPRKVEGESIAWLRALRYLGKPFLLVLFIVTFIDSTIHNSYFLMAGGFLSHAGIPDKWLMPVMSLGQIAEILTMVVLGAVLSRLGWKTTMTIGIMGHAMRFAVFAFMPDSQAMLIVVQALHGICYAFFFATLYIFIDAAFPHDVRASAQGLFNLLVLGVGDLAAKWIFIPLQASLIKPDKTGDYKTLFLYPTYMALAAIALMLFCFWPPKKLVDEVVQK